MTSHIQSLEGSWQSGLDLLLLGEGIRIVDFKDLNADTIRVVVGAGLPVVRVVIDQQEFLAIGLHPGDLPGEADDLAILTLNLIGLLAYPLL